MSVRINVSNNPVTVKRASILLTDVEFAKKQEWERRRKLRLLQVRQQAKDLACSLRNKVRSEKDGISNERQKKCSDEMEQWKKKQLDNLYGDYEGCLAELGAAHQSAQNQPDEHAVLREQQELMAALSRARGQVAMKKVQDEKSVNRQKQEAVQKCREMARNLENIRAQMVASMPKPPSTLPVTSKRSRTIAKNPSPSGKVCKRYDRCGVRVSPAKSREGRQQRRNFAEASTETVPEAATRAVLAQTLPSHFRKSPTKKLCFDESTEPGPSSSRPRNQPGQHLRKNRSVSPVSRRKQRVSECDYESDGSGDSDVTWPPRSSGCPRRSSRPKLVEVYDHNSRTCHQYLRSASSVTCVPSTSQQVELTPETLKDEGGRVYKAELEQASAQAQWRGRQAMRKDRLRKEFSTMLQELTNLDREERMRRVNCERYVAEHSRKQDKSKPVLDANILCKTVAEGKSQIPPKHRCSDKNDEESVPPFAATKHHVKIPMESTSRLTRDSKETENSLKQLLETLHNKRRELMKDQFHYLDTAAPCVETLSDNENERSDDDIEIPEWITDPVQEDANRPQLRAETSFEENQEAEAISDEPDNNLVEKDTSIHSPKSPKEIPVKRTSPETSPKRKQFMDCDLNNKDPSFVENNNPEPSENHEGSFSRNENVRQEESQDSLERSETSSSSFEGIKLIIKVAEKKKKSAETSRKICIPEDTVEINDSEEMDERKQNVTPSWRGQLNGESSGSTSTSYYSPPEYLNPTQKGLLSSILNRIEVKNKNPKLNQYILRLLEMSRESIDNLSETVSDVSIQSDIINRINESYMDRRLAGDGYNGDRKRQVQKPCSRFNYDQRNVSTKQVGTEPAADKMDDSSTESDETKLYSDLAERYSQRIKALAQMINGLNLAPCNSDLNNTTSYLNVPSEIRESVRMSDSIMRAARTGLYPRPEQTFEDSGRFSRDSANDKQCNLNWKPPERPCLNEEHIAAMGLKMNILPKPDVEKTLKKSTSKPPSTLGGISLRRNVPSAVPHELSVITEVDTPSTSRYLQSCLPSERHNSQQARTSPELIEEDILSCVGSEADLDVSSIAPCSPQRPVRNQYDFAVAGPSAEPNVTLKSSKCDESSLSIISDLSDCSLLNGRGALTESSSENLEEVFRSLGIAWAWTTLRKIKEAKQLSSSTPSPELNQRENPCNRSGNNSVSHPKSYSKYKHSTPVKKHDRPATRHVPPKPPQTSFGGSELSSVTGSSRSSDSWSLTPPCLTLITPSLVQPQNGKKTH